MNGKTDAWLDLAAIPAVGATLLDPRPAFVFAGDGGAILFANAAGAAFFGEAKVGALVERRFAGPLSRQVVRLAKTLPSEIHRTEMLRFCLGANEFAVAAQCRRLALAGDGRAVLAIAAVGGARESRGATAERIAEALAADGSLVAVLGHDGRIVGASAGFAELSAASEAVSELIGAAAAAITGLVRQPIAVNGASRAAGVVEFDAASDTLYLVVVEPAPDRPTSEPAAAPVPEATAGLEAIATAAPSEPIVEAVPATPVLTPVPVAQLAPRSEPPAFSEEDIDDVARKSIEEGRRIAAASTEAKEPPALVEEPKRAPPAPPKPVALSNVVRMPGAPVRAFPPERLTGTEQDAFRRIAEALGVKMPVDTDERGRRTEGGSAIEADAAAEARLLDKLPVGVIVYSDRETLFANRALLDLLGYATFADFAAAGGADAVFPDGAAAKPAKGGKGEVNARRRDGSGLPVEARLHAVAWGAQSAAMLSLVKRADGRRDPLPDRKFMADLAASGDRVEELEAILDTATDGVVVIDAEGRIGNFNRSAEALFGVPAAEVLGTPFTELFAEESRKAALDYLDGLAQNGVASVLNDGREVIGKVPKGGLIPLFMTIGRISGGQKFCAVLRDITHWKNVEEELTAAKKAAETANAQKSEFLAKISHEIRTPLNAIIGFSEVMMEERFGAIANERYRAYLRDIHVSGAHLMSLINDLLDLSKIEAGKVDLAFESVAINDVIQECVALMQPQANRERIIIRTSLSAGVPNVVADPRSLRQILLNLLSNAIKFTQAGGQVIVATALEENGEVELRIRDTGVGMSEKDIETAMKPFRQVGAARDRGEGTGLGLPLTKALVEANRATFAITSAPNQGTLVRVTFPTTRVLAG